MELCRGMAKDFTASLVDDETTEGDVRFIAGGDGEGIFSGDVWRVS